MANSLLLSCARLLSCFVAVTIAAHLFVSFSLTASSYQNSNLANDDTDEGRYFYSGDGALSVDDMSFVLSLARVLGKMIMTIMIERWDERAEEEKKETRRRK